ncbi:MAG: hypothetical protein AAB322_02965, partial [Pseudomonadota bacterium]
NSIAYNTYTNYSHVFNIQGLNKFIIDGVNNKLSSLVNIDLNSNKIVNCADPTSFSDVSNKNYVDNQILNINFSPYLKKDGTVLLTGNLNNNNLYKISNSIEPTVSSDLTTKNYVDTQIGTIDLTNYFKKDGTTPMTGNINLNNYYLNNVNSIVGTTTGLTFNINTGLSYYFKIADTEIFNISENNALSIIGSINMNGKTKIQQSKIYVNEAINSGFSMTTTHTNSHLLIASNTADLNPCCVKIQNLSQSITAGSVMNRIDFMGKTSLGLEYWAAYIGNRKLVSESDKNSSLIFAPRYELNTNPNGYFEMCQRGTTAKENTLFIGSQFTSAGDTYGLYMPEQGIYTTTLDLKNGALHDTQILFKNGSGTNIGSVKCDNTNDRLFMKYIKYGTDAQIAMTGNAINKIQLNFFSNSGFYVGANTAYNASAETNNALYVDTQIKTTFTSALANGFTSWTNYSDQRLKKNIVDIDL